MKGSPHFTVVGHTTDMAGGYQLLDKQGGQHELKAQGWDALRA